MPWSITSIILLVWPCGILLLSVLSGFIYKDLLTNALGSFFGAILFLKVEDLWEVSKARERYLSEAEHASAALDVELRVNLNKCNQVIDLISESDDGLTEYAGLELFWTHRYQSSYIDYANNDSIRLSSYFQSFQYLTQKSLLTQDSSIHYHRAISLNHSEVYRDNAKKMLIKSNQRLKAQLESIKEIVTIILDTRTGAMILLNSLEKNESFKALLARSDVNRIDPYNPYRDEPQKNNP